MYCGIIYSAKIYLFFSTCTSPFIAAQFTHNISFIGLNYMSILKEWLKCGIFTRQFLQSQIMEFVIHKMGANLVKQINSVPERSILYIFSHL